MYGYYLSPQNAIFTLRAFFVGHLRPVVLETLALPVLYGISCWCVSGFGTERELSAECAAPKALSAVLYNGLASSPRTARLVPSMFVSGYQKTPVLLALGKPAAQI
jgi:hypothetical protein